jgi:hypothetical protein
MALLGIISSASTGRIALALLGAAIGFSVFLIGILRGQAGAGDAKMAGALGAWLGLGVLPVIIIACVMGLAWSNIRSLRSTNGRPLSMLPEDGTVHKALPFGGVLGGRRLRLDYTVVSLATAFHGNLAPLTLLTTSPKDAQAADKEIVSSRIYASHNLLRSDDFLYWIACLKRWLHE